VTINDQIEWVQSQVRYMKKNHPAKVEAGELSKERATYLLACASATLQTLTQLRGLVQVEVQKL